MRKKNIKLLLSEPGFKVRELAQNHIVELLLKMVIWFIRKDAGSWGSSVGPGERHSSRREKTRASLKGKAMRVEKEVWTVRYHRENMKADFS